MKFEKVEDLKLWERANEFWDAVTRILDRPCIRRHRKLHEQLNDAVDSILSNISEGFEQPTDRGFANYLYTAKASTAEVRTCLKLFFRRGYITKEEFAACDALGDEIPKIATGLIKYLLESDRRDRTHRRRVNRRRVAGRPRRRNDGNPRLTTGDRQAD
jgi:four helix bundle protein